MGISCWVEYGEVPPKRRAARPTFALRARASCYQKALRPHRSGRADRAGVAVSALRLPRSSFDRISDRSAPARVAAPVQCVAGLVPNATPSASAERRCKKNGDDDHSDDSRAGDEQSAIHG
jgi:hypothetical protein